MERLLAMSILSSGPADLSGGGGSANGWFARNRTSKLNEGAENSKTSSSSESQLRPAKKEELLRCALELDGLHCFETIVSK